MSDSFLSGIDPDTRLPYGVSRYYAQLAESENPETDPIAAQFIPRKGELVTLPVETPDPIGDRRYLVEERLVHHYRDRVLLLVNDRCATYCRHCFRRHFTGHGGGRITEEQLDRVCGYLQRTPAVKEILLSGGDPLMLPDAELDKILTRVKLINPDYIIRLCTRMPVVLPSRITHQLAATLGRHGSVWAIIHTNHPREITDEFRHAVKTFMAEGIPVLNQAVLLRGINDRVDTLEQLFRGLVQAGVKPYYLFQGDLAAGTSHFRVPVERGIELMRELRSRLSGIAIPTYAVDLPDGGGKVPVEASLLRTEAEWYVFRGPEGGEYRYPRETS
jgi:lysine 2,3-aminomutase